jgi:hypothetical protein
MWWGGVGRRIVSRVGLGKYMSPYPKKQTKTKGARGMAQVIEHIYNTLSSNPNTTKK